MAGEAGTAEVLPASGAPAGVPGGEGTPAPAQGGGSSSAQPEGGAQAQPEGGAEGKAPDPHVPWSKFREVQTAHSRLRREYDTATRKATEQVSAFERDLAEASKYKNDYEALSEALRAHPDIAEALQERLKGGTGRPAQPAPAAALSPELLQRLDKVDKLYETVEAARQGQMQAQQRAEDAQVDGQLQQTLQGCLAARQYSEKLLPQARRYVLGRIREMGDDADDLTMDDVKYLFAEWYKDMETFHQERVGRSVVGLREDQRLPPVPGGSSPAKGEAQMGALDGQTSRVLEQALRERGWGG